MLEHQNHMCENGWGWYTYIVFDNKYCPFNPKTSFMAKTLHIEEEAGESRENIEKYNVETPH